MCDYTLHLGRKQFCRYFLQAFRTAEISKFHIKTILKLMVNKGLKCQKKMNKLDSKIMKDLPFTIMIYANFEII